MGNMDPSQPPFAFKATNHYKGIGVAVDRRFQKGIKGKLFKGLKGLGFSIRN